MSYHKSDQYYKYSTGNQQCNSYAITHSSDSETDVTSSAENLSHEDRYVICNTLRQEPQGQENKRISLDTSPYNTPSKRNSAEVSYNTLIIHGTPDDHRYSTSLPYSVKHQSPVTTLSHKERRNSPRRSFDPSVSEITNIPDDYLSQSQVLKHLAKEVKVPSYSTVDHNRVNDCNRKSSDWHYHVQRKTFKSKSQPDLTKLHKNMKSEISPMRHALVNKRKEQRCMQMMDHLIQENNNLKMELEASYQKVAKSQKLEQEVGKVHRAHEDLVESCERRERLERAARSKLQNEILKLKDTNRALREQIESMSKQVLSSRTSHSDMNYSKGDALIAQLVAQNKELLASKDRQEIELSAQRVTLEEQRTHIDILDTALTNAQANVVRLEEESRKKQIHVDRVAQLQRALASLQQASERREQAERKLRIQLENELRMERTKNNKSSDNLDTGESLGELKRKMREKDEKIMQLEGQVAKWEQRYLEESELRQAAIDAASIPKDAKIAALEKTSQESEKIIAEARSDKLRHMDEVHAAQKKVTDLESRMKELESKLAERDAMIRVLQNKHSYEKDNVSMSLSEHSPHSSHHLGAVCTTSTLSSSTSFGSSYTGSVNNAFHPRQLTKYTSSNQSFDEKSLDDQLKELDSQLLSKRGLCCFPGFSHPGTLSRKGNNTPEPLLAGVTNNATVNSSIIQGLMGVATGQLNNRPDDMLFLEKQGLSSQAQRNTDFNRAASLPPSSLPRPKRHRKSPNTSKVGEYGRLSDTDVTASSNKTQDLTKKFGHYRRLNNEPDRKSPDCIKLNELNKMSPNSSTDLSSRESPSRTMVVSLSDRSNSPTWNKSRESSGRSILVKWGEYNKLDIAKNERKYSTDSSESCERPIKARSTSVKSLIPTPKKVSDYSCFSVSEQDNKLGPNIQSKLRIFSPGGVAGRRGSLQRESSRMDAGGGVRSLPTPNKYRIHF